jgi:hypothetical protein
MITDLILQKIKEEIEKDPEGIGYAGKTDDEIMILLNTSVRKDRIVTDGYPPPINRILTAIADAPNVVTKEEVTTAKAFVVKEI